MILLENAFQKGEISLKGLAKGDILLLLLLLSAVLAGFLIFRSRGEAPLYAEIRAEGQPARYIPLTGHKGREAFEVITPLGRNLVVVEEETVLVAEADCPDKVCVKTGRLERAGETAACLPHKLLIEIKEGSPPR